MLSSMETERELVKLWRLGFNPSPCYLHFVTNLVNLVINSNSYLTCVTPFHIDCFGLGTFVEKDLQLALKNKNLHRNYL